MRVTYQPGPRDSAEVEWMGIVFPNVPVDVTTPHILMKVKGNPFFSASEDEDPKDDEKDALQAQAEALGIDVDGRWGVAKLKAAIAAKTDGHDENAA